MKQLYNSIQSLFHSPETLQLFRQLNLCPPRIHRPLQRPTRIPRRLRVHHPCLIHRLLHFMGQSRNHAPRYPHPRSPHSHRPNPRNRQPHRPSQQSRKSRLLRNHFRPSRRSFHLRNLRSRPHLRASRGHRLFQLPHHHLHLHHFAKAYRHRHCQH